MKKWEYHILNTGDGDDWIQTSDTINDLGKKGWELMKVIKDSHAGDLERHLYIFKRPLKE